MSAGFRWTVDSQPRVLVLNKPMAFEPAPAHRKNRWAVDSLDYSAREVISIASGRMEVEATIKFEKNAQGLVDMLRDAADGNVVTYYPDLSNGTGYALWLVSESTELAPQAGNWSLGNYEVRTRWRDASASGTSIAPLFERLLFRLDAGHFPLGYSFTRSGSVGPYIDSDGVLKSAAENITRIEWVDLDGDGARETPGLLLEAGATNLVTSDDLTAWTASGTPVVTGSQSDPAGGTGAYTVADDSGAATEGISRTVTFTSSAQKAVVFVVRENTHPASGDQALKVFDTSAAADRLRLGISAWTDGEPTVAASTGTYLGKRLIGDGFWAIYGRTTSVTHTNTNRVEILPASTAAQTGSIDVYRVNAYNATVPPASILDASETLGADTFYAPFTAAPQEMTAYVKFVELGTAQLSGTVRLFQISDAAGSDARFTVFSRSAGGRYSASWDNGIVGAVTAPDTGLTVPSFGDVVEVVGKMTVSGGQVSVALDQSIGGGTVETTGSSPEAALVGSFSAERIYLNSFGSSSVGIANFLSVKIAAGTKTMAEMRAL